jgi:hypothetical protein
MFNDVEHGIKARLEFAPSRMIEPELAATMHTDLLLSG